MYIYICLYMFICLLTYIAVPRYVIVCQIVHSSLIPPPLKNCVSHVCLLCLSSGRVSHCVLGFTEVGSYYYSRK